MPKHVHIEKSGMTAKFNLNPIELVVSKKFSANELREIRILIQLNLELINASWDGYFN